MYMYYLLGHKLMDLDISIERKTTIADNTYLLALDGDIDFTPDAVQMLVDLMKKNRNVGAACGRIHPVGSGKYHVIAFVSLFRSHTLCFYLDSFFHSFTGTGFNEPRLFGKGGTFYDLHSLRGTGARVDFDAYFMWLLCALTRRSRYHEKGMAFSFGIPIGTVCVNLHVAKMGKKERTLTLSKRQV